MISMFAKHRNDITQIYTIIIFYNCPYIASNADMSAA